MDDHWQAQCLLLHSIPSLSDQHLCQLLLHYGGPRQVCESDTRDWAGLGVPARAVAAAQLALDRGGHPQAPLSLAEQGARLASCGATILAVSSADYPPLLRAIHDPPPFLYLRGQAALLARAQLAVVPMQDFLGLGSEARMNTPGTTEDNWRWRLTPGQLGPGETESILGLVEESSRRPG